MLGVKFIKFDAMSYVIQYVRGKVQREGKGLSFFYYEPRSSISVVPLGTMDLPFVFQETSLDYQNLTLQGQITYRVAQPAAIAEKLDFSVDSKGTHKTDDWEKLEQRLINVSKSSASATVQQMDIRSGLRKKVEIQRNIFDGLANSEMANMLGLEIINVSLMSVTPAPEMLRALEANTREDLQKEADKAIFDRRNFAVEQERKIKESELNTQIAIEEKNRQIEEKKMEIQLSIKENDRKLREMSIEADIEIEGKRKEFTEIKVANDRLLSDSAEYRLRKSLEPYEKMEWKTIMAIKNNGQSAGDNIALAFRELAENSQNIQNLNITPDLLQSITKSK